MNAVVKGDLVGSLIVLGWPVIIDIPTALIVITAVSALMYIKNYRNPATSELPQQSETSSKSYIMLKHFIITLLFFILFKCAQAQQTGDYPKVVGYFSIVNPVGTWTKDGFTSNFANFYSVGFPFGLNLLKSDRFGVSFEVAPLIRTEKNMAKVSTVLFHPGAMFRFRHGLTFIGRMAFETNGRFGVTPVFNQVIKRGRDASLFVAVPFPVRFGNNLPASVGTGLQLGVSF